MNFYDENDGGVSGAYILYGVCILGFALLVGAVLLFLKIADYL